MRNKLLRMILIPQKGFTLIELLVVLGILGILAAVLLAAINPIEQLNKAQDSSDKQIATEYVAALTQYYSVHNTLPSDSSIAANAACNTAAGAGAGVTFANQTLVTLAPCTTILMGEGELKNSFSSVSNLKDVTVTVTLPVGTTTYTTFACFKPKSHAGQLDSNTKYNVTGGNGAGCISGGGAAACYWCAQ